MYNIGVDLGGTNVAIGIVNENYEITNRVSFPTKAQRPQEEIAEDMANAIVSLIKESGIQKEEINSIGIAAPGTVNPENGTIEYVCNLPFLQYPICKIIGEKTGINNVYLDNDANVAALGEHVAGAARGSKDSILITLGTGVGGGIIINGKIYSGFNYAGAELGHMVIEYNGVPCNCGRQGCWESYSSATALVRMTKEKMDECKDSQMWEVSKQMGKVNGKTSFEAARRGDKAGQEVVDKYLSYLACGLCNIINMFQPEILSIGGGVSNEKTDIIGPLNKLIRAQEYGARIGVERRYTQLKIAELKNDAGIIGAAVLGSTL